MPKYEVGDSLKSGDNSFSVHEIEEDLETRQPIYVDEKGLCFREDQCKRTRRVKK